MSKQNNWRPVEPDIDSILSVESEPLQALSEGHFPAIILRQAIDPAQCQGLIQRFIDRGLMRDPDDAEAAAEDPRVRIDIGTSLGNKGSDQEGFLQHASETHELFQTLFDGFDNPVTVMYDTLQALAGSKSVKVAREPDGREYGPAIFRVHYETQSYHPHIDHVTLREKRFNYAVSRFEHQFAGVLCFQNAEHEGRSTQSILHKCLWTPEIQPYIESNTFHEYAASEHIPNYRVDLEQGDLYFFNTRHIHEVPPVEGSAPRIVLAVFIGYSTDDPEIYVWS